MDILHILSITIVVRCCHSNLFLYIPVIFHNLAGYDAHLFIRELAKHVTGMGVIAKNTEDYISFSLKVEVDKYIDKNGNECIKEMELKFKDSIKFMSSSLDSLVDNLAKGGHELFGFESYIVASMLIAHLKRNLPIQVYG